MRREIRHSRNRAIVLIGLDLIRLDVDHIILIVKLFVH